MEHWGQRNCFLAFRLDTVTDGAFNAKYSYIANSALVGQIEFRQNSTVRMSTTNSFDFINRLQSKASHPGGAPSAESMTYSYLYNDANQRTRLTLADGSYWEYQYDSLGQVKSGKRRWNDGTWVAGQQFEYGFDDIGNRTSAKAGGDSGGANLRAASYTPNLLNQYSSRTVPGAVDILGLANSAATVTVNGGGTYRRGEYFHLALNVNNGSGAVWQSVSVNAVNGGASETTSGNLFSPPATENYAHDLDGNLLSDGRWNYTWDAENRLRQVESLASNPAPSKRRIVYEYDCQGRRIRETRYDGSSGSYLLSSDRKYLYDGWRCVTEIASQV